MREDGRGRGEGRDEKVRGTDKGVGGGRKTISKGYKRCQDRRFVLKDKRRGRRYSFVHVPKKDNTFLKFTVNFFKHVKKWSLTKLVFKLFWFIENVNPKFSIFFYK